MFVKGSFTNYNVDLSCAKLELTAAHLENKIFDDWEIAPWELFIFEDKLLGEGASSKVYLAKWRETLVVAKVIDPEFAKIKKSVVLREIAIMSKLHHPNIVQFLGFIDDPFIIVLEYIVNGTISSNMRNFNKKQKISIMKDILRGLAYLHNRRPLSLIHRDIKPSNILITSSKMAKIADFGLSKFYNKSNYNDSSNNVCSCVGSRRYMAPEIYNRAGPYNHKVDIYSAGIVFYELLESKTYIPYNSLKWFYASNHLKKIISEFMVSHDPYKRYDALDILKLI
jgi:serine/threonine protein kinase